MKTYEVDVDIREPTRRKNEETRFFEIDNRDLAINLI